MHLGQILHTRQNRNFPSEPTLLQCAIKEVFAITKVPLPSRTKQARRRGAATQIESRACEAKLA